MNTTLDRRERRRRATVAEIKRTARQHMAEEGANNLSLGAIARMMGMTPPALYRYFESRQALVAALMIDAYDAMGQALEQSLVEQAARDPAEQFLALLRAYRRWAMAQPEAYALMYIASMEAGELSEAQMPQFEQAVLRSMGAMVQVLKAAHAEGCLIVPRAYDDPPAAVRRALLWMREVLRDDAVPLGLLALALTTWLRVDGLVWQELHGHLPKPLFGEGEFFAMECAALAAHLGLPEVPDGHR